jgi:hypothetical protein
LRRPKFKATPALLSEIRSNAWDKSDKPTPHDHENVEKIVKDTERISTLVKLERNVNMCKLKHLKKLIDEEIENHISHLENSFKFVQSAKTAYHRFVLNEVYGFDYNLDSNTEKIFQKPKSKIDRTTKNVITSESLVNDEHES